MGRALVSAHGIYNFYPILQVSCRKPRYDDCEVSDLFKAIPHDEYKEIEFISNSEHGSYGIPKNNFERFLFNGYLFGISTITSNEVMVLKKLLDSEDFYRSRINIFIVLLTLDVNKEKELHRLKKTVDEIFLGSEKEKRYELHSTLVKRYFHHEQYKKDYVDLHLCRSNMTVYDYCATIEEKLFDFFGFKLIYDAEALKKHTDILCKRIRTKRKKKTLLPVKDYRYLWLGGACILTCLGCILICKYKEVNLTRVVSIFYKSKKK